MANPEKQNWFVWVILTLCVIAIPIGLIGNQVARRADSDDAANLMLKFTDHIQVVKLTGMIADKEEKSILFSGDDSASGVLKQFRKALKNEHVKAILLRVNSPGGTVSASQEVSEAVKAFRKSGRPVVVSMGDLAASGGYYVACASDRILAEPGTLTGSIGVIMNLMNFKSLADKVGVEPEVIKSGQFKDIASPLRAMTAPEKEILQTLIMDSYDQFVTAVAEGRKMKVEEVKHLADGRVYSGRQALKLKLIDELGGYDEAVDALQKICMDRFHLSEKLPVEEKSSEGLLSMFFESSATHLAPLGSEHNGLFSEVIPQSFNPTYTHQPLWMWQ